ncbi:MAG: hemerythrin family protein [Nitrospirae bacterium]|nr:hemerythrin family protein [Nitrospirota bacterium]
MAIEWNDNLSTGVDLIDEQHKELFRRLNQLFEACREGRGKGQANGMLKFLEDYVVTHFGTEEKHMKEHAYPNYVAHRSQHLAFIESFNDLKRKVKDEGIGPFTVVALNRIVVDWLTAHIRKVDREMGSYLKGKI